MTITLVVIGLFILVMINVPIAVGLGVVAVVGMIISRGFDSVFNAALTMFDGATNFPLLAIPLFILAGALMNTTSISRRLINLTSALIGFVRGGLAMVNVGVSMFFAEISGSAVADVAAIGSVLIPAMVRRNYTARLAAAVTSSSASIAIIIPPSIAMIIYGALADASIVQLFVAGVVPGVLGGLAMMALCYWYAVRHDLPREEAFDLGRLWKAFKEAGWALLLPVIILGGIFGGIVTATEGAGLAVVAALVIGGAIYRELSWKHLRKAMIEGVMQTAVVMLLVATSAVLGLYLTEIQLPQNFARWVMELTNNKYAVLALLNCGLFVIGMFLHGAAAIILVVPIVMPLIHQIGIDPIQFGLIMTLNIAVGQQTPPVASVLVTSCSIAKTDIWETTKVNIPFIAVLLGILLMVTYVPAISLTLVDFFYK
ncbi:MAG: TRAP transporter large permease [Deltaproteobacteria bacterium]|jgi:tripartite ATP-independent transporter DctM subunit|nr:TRAP transporter large permease [Deltaproteobacteria bacterium]MBW2480648.1 TRAP transporter large permease [Deltaproteobacteria bacterium]